MFQHVKTSFRGLTGKSRDIEAHLFEVHVLAVLLNTKQDFQRQKEKESNDTEKVQLNN